MGWQMLQGSTDDAVVRRLSTTGKRGGIVGVGGTIRMPRVLRRIAGPLLAVLALSGCAFPGQLQQIAVEQNQVVANTADSLTLLNILRASEGRPLHFTSISRISGNVDFGVTGAVGAGIEISGGSAASLSPAAGAAISSNPNFDLTIHDSQEFQRGIMQPIAPEIISYYLRTGWRSDLLTYLLVERIDFIAEGDTVIDGRAFKDGEVVSSLENDPADPAAVQQFRAFVACYTLSSSQRPGDSLPLKKFSEMQPVGMSDLALLDGAKLDLGKGPGSSTATDDWVVRKQAGGQAVGLTRTQGAGCAGQTVAVRGGGSIKARIDPAVATIDPRKTKTVDVLIEGRAAPVKSSIDITFRSVDGVIYFLGEYARASRDGRTIYEIPNSAAGLEPLLLIAPGRGGRHDLSAELSGAAWHVPADCRCRSFQVIALIEQLFNLHKSGSAVPLSTAVRVVN